MREHCIDIHNQHLVHVSGLPNQLSLKKKLKPLNNNMQDRFIGETMRVLRGPRLPGTRHQPFPIQLACLDSPSRRLRSAQSYCLSHPTSNRIFGCEDVSEPYVFLDQSHERVRPLTCPEYVDQFPRRTYSLAFPAIGDRAAVYRNRGLQRTSDGRVMSGWLRRRMCGGLLDRLRDRCVRIVPRLSSCLRQRGRRGSLSVRG